MPGIKETIFDDYDRSTLVKEEIVFFPGLFYLVNLSIPYFDQFIVFLDILSFLSCRFMFKSCDFSIPEYAMYLFGLINFENGALLPSE